MKFLSRFLFLLLMVVKTNAADGFWLMSTNMAITLTDDWRPYDGGDMPEGAYMGWVRDGFTNLSGAIPLGRTIPAGTYQMMVKIIDYDGSPGQIKVELGDGTSTVTTLNSDWNKYWTLPLTIATSYPTNQITLNLIKTISAEISQKYLVGGLYITTNVNENVPLYGFDRIIDYTYPTTEDTNSLVPGNTLPDGSFETGFGHGWGILAVGYERNESIQSWWVTNGISAYHGTGLIKFPIEAILYSRVHVVKPNKTYTLSAWVKAPSDRYIGMGIYNVTTPPPGFTNVVNLYNGSFPVTTNWTRISISGVLWLYPNSNYQISFYANPDTCIDAIQLEEGSSATTFNTASKVEVGFASDKPGRILYNDEATELDVLLANSGDSTFNGNLVYKIFDVGNNVSSSGQNSISIPANSRLTQSLTVPSSLGIFRIQAWIDGLANSMEEYTYAVIKRSTNSTVDETSNFGIHPNLVDYQLEMHQRMGIKWARALSPEGIFRWNEIEITEGTIIWEDEKVNRAPTYGMSILGTIGSNDGWPSWANTNSLPDLDKWESFVSRLVAHYKDRIHYWEVWNEPIYNFTAVFYASLLERAAIAIRAEDPTATIVGMGGSHDKDWILAVMNQLGSGWTNSLDIISTHLYPASSDPMGGQTEAGAEAFKEEIIDVYGVDVWNTETGVWDEGFYKGLNSSMSLAGTPIWESDDSERFVKGSRYESERLMINLLICLGNGMTKYFYYDSRINSNPNYQKSHPTMLEYDDSIRSKGITYAIAGSFLDRSVSLGIAITNSSAIGYVFERSGLPTVALWSTDKLNHTITLPSGDWTAFDMMGNPITFTGSVIPFGRTPMYVKSDTNSPSTVKANFLAASIGSLSDIQAPNLSFDEFPTGAVISGSTVPVRWLAIDDTSIPSHSDTLAVLYSRQLVEMDSDWSEWTPETYTTLESIPNGSYTFRVKAKDQAGNISTNSIPVVFGDSQTRHITISGTITAGTLTVAP